MLGIDGQAGHYSHFGIEKGLTDLLQEHSVSSGVMSLQFNFDGLPLFKSANMELWPILCLAKSVHRTPFVVGLYCGPKKPASVSDCLHELCSLLMNGCTCDRGHYKIEIGCFVCDAPARSFVKNIKSHRLPWM